MDKEIKPVEDAGAFLSKEEKKGLLKEEKQVKDGDKRTDEVRDEVSEPVAEVIAEVSDIPKEEAKEDVENAIEGEPEAKPEPEQKLNEGYKDGQLERNEEQQEAFNKAKAEADEEAKKWQARQRDAQLSQRATEQPESKPETNQAIERGESEANSGELSTKDLANYEKDILDAFSHDHRKDKHPGKNREERLENARKELEDLEFNPNDFLTDEEKNDIDYKPSQEELDAFNKAQREEWEANGRPRNKDVADKTIDDPDGMLRDSLEEDIEANPGVAEEAAEQSFGEGSPIENEAEQANDSSDSRDDEVNNAEIEEGLEQATPDELESFEDFYNRGLNEDLAVEGEPNVNTFDEGQNIGGVEPDYEDPVINPDLGNQGQYDVETGSIKPEPDVVDNGLEDMNQYAQAPVTQNAIDQANQQMQANMDKTIADPDMQISPEMQVQKLSPEEVEDMMAPLKQELQGLGQSIQKAQEEVDKAQRRFDADPSERNAEALKQADLKLQDANAAYDNKLNEYNEVLRETDNFYKQLEEESEPEEELTEEKKPEFEIGLPDLHTPLSIHGSTHSMNPNGVAVNNGSHSSGGHPNRITGSIGSLANGSVGHGSMAGASPRKDYWSINSKASKAPTPKAVVTDNVGRAVQIKGRPSSNGSMNSGSHGLMSNNKKNGAFSVAKAQLPSFTGHTSSGTSSGTSGGTSGGTSAVANGRDALVKWLISLVDELTPEERKSLGFSPNRYGYQHQPLKKLDGYTIQKLIEQIEDYLYF